MDSKVVEYTDNSQRYQTSTSPFANYLNGIQNTRREVGSGSDL